jgi:hypothetical protein
MMERFGQIVSSTASKPIEADMLQTYNPQQPIDEKA